MVAVAEVLQTIDLVGRDISAAEEAASLLVVAVTVQGDTALRVFEGIVTSGVDAAVLFKKYLCQHYAG